MAAGDAIPDQNSGKYEVLSTIGKGSFGTIRKVRRISDGHVLCRKEIQYLKMSVKEREQLQAEFVILHSLNHPNIVGYCHREHLKTTQELYIYMEYCGGGDLSQEIQRLQDRKEYADEGYVWNVFTQLVEALYRCHYDADAPKAGKLTGAPRAIKPMGLRAKNAAMILHRDLKPENVFLGADNMVKLGDFGLSKRMGSQDFASTYVGTPFYMSPEICAGERYSLYSDIWSLGCVMYELCAQTQPFNAKTHYHLIQKIRDGQTDPLPSVYSQELKDAILSCLNVSSRKRPDTATLLDLPSIRTVRKEREIAEAGAILRDREEHANLKIREADARMAKMNKDIEQIKAELKAELEASMRREWEVKARLEISQRVQQETEKLNLKFEEEVRQRVAMEVDRRLRSSSDSRSSERSEPKSPKGNPAFSSVSTCVDSDLTSTTDLSSLSLDALTLGAPPEMSEITSQTPPPRKPGRVLEDSAEIAPVTSKTPPVRRLRKPLERARTQFDSPMDTKMPDPSPMSVDYLGLSPRHGEIVQASMNLPNRANIFAIDARTRLVPQSLSPTSSLMMEEEEDRVGELSPTRPHTNVADPFKVNRRPGLVRQNTAPTRHVGEQNASIFAPSKIEQAPRGPPSPSPKRSALSPARKPPPKPAPNGMNAGGLRGLAQRNAQNTQVIQGRTLTQLNNAQQGKPVQLPTIQKGNLVGPDRKENLLLWDPESDEMPSPFLVRGGNRLRRI